MKHTGFVFSAKAQLEITREDAYFLCAVAKLHYDSVCRSAEDDPGPDAFLNGLRNRFWKPEIKTVTVEWSFRECDISRKILEMAHLICDDGKSFTDGRSLAAHAFELDKALNAAQTGINEKTAQANNSTHLTGHVKITLDNLS